MCALQQFERLFFCSWFGLGFCTIRPSNLLVSADVIEKHGFQNKILTPSFLWEGFIFFQKCVLGHVIPTTDRQWSAYVCTSSYLTWHATVTRSIAARPNSEGRTEWSLGGELLRCEILLIHVAFECEVNRHRLQHSRLFRQSLHTEYVPATH